MAIYHNDHLGTPQKITAVNGAVVWSAKYSSFGKANVEIETVENNLRFPGQYFDQETGLHYNMWRYYDTDMGRYLRADPIGLEGGINPFVYSMNNPIIKSDPYGLRVKPGTTGDLIGMVNTYSQINTGFEMTSEVIDALNKLAYEKIECNEKVLAHVCYKIGPPPHSVSAGLGEVIFNEETTNCFTGMLTGLKDCCDFTE